MSPKKSFTAIGILAVAGIIVIAGVTVAAPSVLGTTAGDAPQQTRAHTNITVLNAGCSSTLEHTSSTTNSRTFEKTGILYTNSSTRNLSASTTRMEYPRMTAFNVTVSAADANTSSPSSESPCGGDEQWGVKYHLTVDVPPVDNAAFAVIQKGDVAGCAVWTGELPSYCKPNPSASY